MRVMDDTSTKEGETASQRRLPTIQHDGDPKTKAPPSNKPCTPNKPATSNIDAIPHSTKNRNEANQTEKDPDADLPKGVRRFFGTVSRRIDSINNSLDNIDLRNQRIATSWQGIIDGEDFADNENSRANIEKFVQEIDEKVGEVRKWIFKDAGKRKMDEYVFEVFFWRWDVDFSAVVVEMIRLETPRKGRKWKEWPDLPENTHKCIHHRKRLGP